jgi:hypothetical protein
LIGRERRNRIELAAFRPQGHRTDVASISYWFLSPSLILALIGKWRGWDKTDPTPAVDWRKVAVDVAIPAKNEERHIAYCLSSVLAQDFPVRKITVIDDASTDGTAALVKRFGELSGRQIELVSRAKSIGKTPALREQCRSTDADALVIIDADTVMVSGNYIARIIEELFKNAGVAAACGEVMPLTGWRRRRMAASDRVLNTLVSSGEGRVAEPGYWASFPENVTILYRRGLYLLLQRVFYDGHQKLFGGLLSPVGCAAAYKTARLRECFDYTEPRLGDNLSMSEDIYIGHFFNWKGYRTFQVAGVTCESTEPPVTVLPRQLFLWSSGFLQSAYYFKDLIQSPFRRARRRKNTDGAGLHARLRRVREQYRAPWGEEVTRRQCRAIGWVELTSAVEKITYPLALLAMFVFWPDAALLTICLEAVMCTALTMWVADPGSRLGAGGAMLLATPIRVLSLGVDLVVCAKYLADMLTGNRNWRK